MQNILSGSISVFSVIRVFQYTVTKNQVTRPVMVINTMQEESRHGAAIGDPQHLHGGNQVRSHCAFAPGRLAHLPTRPSNER